MLDECGDVRQPLSERRDADDVDVESEVDVLAEAAGPYFGLEVAVRGGHDARRHGERPIATESGDLPLFDDAQQLRLRRGRQFTDLVEKQRTAGRGFERALAERSGARERPPLVAEQLILHEVLRDGRGIERDERSRRVRAQTVQLTGDELLPRPALAHDQDRTRDLRDAPDRVLERLHGGARAHERGLGIEAAPQGGELPREALLLERVLDLLHDAFHRLGLVDEAPGAEPDGLRAAVVVARPGVDEHRHPEPTSLHGPQHFEAVHPRHFQVEDDAVHRFALQQIERRAARERDEHVVAAYALQVVRVLLRHGGYVVHDQDGAHHVSPGSSTMNALPAPGSVSTRNAPLASSTRRRTIDRPRPVPPGFVV